MCSSQTLAWKGRSRVPPQKQTDRRLSGDQFRLGENIREVVRNGDWDGVEGQFFCDGVAGTAPAAGGDDPSFYLRHFISKSTVH